MGLRSGLILGLLVLASTAVAEEPRTVSSLKNPKSVVVGPGGKV